MIDRTNKSFLVGLRRNEDRFVASDRRLPRAQNHSFQLPGVLSHVKTPKGTRVGLRHEIFRSADRRQRQPVEVKTMVFRNFVFATIALLLLGGVDACRCAGPRDLCDYIEAADVVMKAKVISK